MNLQLLHLVGRFWVFFLSHTALRFQLWFHFHLYMWIIHWGLLLRLPWRAWVCPCEGQGWRSCSCLTPKGAGSTRYSGGLAARAAGNTVLQKGMATSIGQYTPVFLPGEPPLTEKPGRPQSTGLQRIKQDRSNLARINTGLFFLIACGSSAPSKS